MATIVEFEDITKRFGPVEALSGVSFSVREQSMHAIVGENGAGKTTLMNILYGAFPATGGLVRLRGKTVHFKSSKEAIENRIGMVSQHYSILPELTCLENLMLGAEPSAWIDLKKAKQRADELAAQMGFTFDWNATADTLSPAAAQKLEILKLLWRDAEILILDEPTAMLSPEDADALFANLQTLIERHATVLLVTHRLPEVLNYCDHVSVLRAGKLVAERSVAQTNGVELAELIVGEPVMSSAPRVQHEAPQASFVARNLSVKGYRGDLAVKDVNFSIGRGEIVGIAGVDGSGQRELFSALVGALPLESGTIEWEGERIDQRSTRDRIRSGFRWVPEDRLEEGVIATWSLVENGIFGLQRLDSFQNGGILNRSQVELQAADCARRFSTKFGSLKDSIGSLSGGNQQRFVLGRAFSNDPRLFLLFQPSRGLDIQAIQRMYNSLRAECEKGASVLIVSFFLDELLEHVDRVLVMRNGSMFEPPAGSGLDRSEIGKLMVGAG